MADSLAQISVETTACISRTLLHPESALRGSDRHRCCTPRHPSRWNSRRRHQGPCSHCVGIILQTLDRLALTTHVQCKLLFCGIVALRAEGRSSNSSVILRAAGDRPDARGSTLRWPIAPRGICRMSQADFSKLAYSIRELAKNGPIGRSSIYNQIAAGRLCARKIGRRTIILDEDWRAFLAGTPAIAPAEPAAFSNTTATPRRHGRPPKVPVGIAREPVKAPTESAAIAVNGQVPDTQNKPGAGS
jgi:hypothetical protein